MKTEAHSSLHFLRSLCGFRALSSQYPLRTTILDLPHLPHVPTFCHIVHSLFSLSLSGRHPLHPLETWNYHSVLIAFLPPLTPHLCPVAAKWTFSKGVSVRITVQFEARKDLSVPLGMAVFDPSNHPLLLRPRQVTASVCDTDYESFPL